MGCCIRRSVCAALLANVAEQASGFDGIHAQIDWVHLPLLQRFDVPFLTTLRGRLDVSGLIAVLRRFPGGALRLDLEPSAAVAAAECNPGIWSRHVDMAS